MWLFALFVAVPLIEIALFIQVGGAIGLWPTLALVLLTAMAGSLLIRGQAQGVMHDLRQRLETLNDPTEPLANGAMIFLAGALLLTPGFFTDSLGLLLLIPHVRSALYRRLRSRVSMRAERMETRSSASAHQHQRRPETPDIVDAEYVEIDPEKRSTHRPSGWTRH